MNEADAIARFEAVASTLTTSGVVLGIGDDAALLTPSDAMTQVACVDTLNLGTHFASGDPAATVGHRALAVNLSDLAAMGATPSWALLSLSMPEMDAAWLGEFLDGFAALAREHGVALVGGDTTRGPLAVSVTLLGFVPTGEALRRGTGAPGDRIYVSGTLGDAAYALAEKGGPTRDRLLRPTPLVALGPALRGVASACIDLSDGLAADLPRLAGASGAVVDAARFPLSEPLASVDGAWRHAVRGGDDYELCFTAPFEAADAVARAAAMTGTPVTEIGKLTDEAAVLVRDPAGVSQPLSDFRGFEHFA